MKTFSTFEIYAGEYHGKLSEDNYDAAVNKAHAEIVSRTNGRALTAGQPMKDNLSMCECEMVDAVHSFSLVPKGISSENTDGRSVTYGGRNSNDGLTGEADTFSEICGRWLRFPENLLGGVEWA